MNYDILLLLPIMLIPIALIWDLLTSKTDLFDNPNNK